MSNYQENALSVWLIEKIRVSCTEAIAKHGLQQNRTLPEWMQILMEEVGELAKELNDYTFTMFNNRKFLDNAEKELVQCMAVLCFIHGKIIEQSGEVVITSVRHLKSILDFHKADRIGRFMNLGNPMEPQDHDDLFTSNS